MAASAGFMTHVTCRLIAKNRDQPRNPRLSNRIWASFFYMLSLMTESCLSRIFYGETPMLQKSIEVRAHGHGAYSNKKTKNFFHKLYCFTSDKSSAQIFKTSIISKCSSVAIYIVSTKIWHDLKQTLTTNDLNARF